MKCPDYLAPFAQKLWPQVVEELDRRGRRLIVHAHQVAMFCQCMSQYRDITKVLNKEGQIAKEEHRSTTLGGDGFDRLKVHPAFQVQSDLVRQAERLIKDMGLNEPLEEKTTGAINSLHGWLERAQSGLQAGERN